MLKPYPIIVTILALTCTSVQMVSPVYATPEIYMTPSSGPPHSELYVGFKWNITIWVEGYGTPPVFAWQVRLNYDVAAGINITRVWAETLINDPAYIFYGKTTCNCGPPTVYPGRVVAADILLFGPAASPPPDPAKLAIIEFEITDAPGKFEVLYTDLQINNSETYLLDDAMNLIPVTKTDGSYTYSWPCCQGPYIAVNPSYKEFEKFTSWNGTKLTAQIEVRDLHVGWNLQNASFELNYNETLTSLESVTIGSAWIGPNAVDISTPGVMSAFVSGLTSSGDVLLLNVTFNFQGQGASPPREYGAYDISQLAFSDIEFWDTVGLIPTDPPVDGLVRVYAFAEYVHDVAVVDVAPSATEAYAGWLVEVNVTIANLGDHVETVDITVHCGSATLESQTVVNLEPSENATVTFNWNTEALTPGDYRIEAEAGILAMEEKLYNNSFADDVVRIRLLGDANGDNSIDIHDIAVVAAAFASYPSHERWSPAADMNGDEKVDIKDIAIVAVKFGIQQS